MRHARDSRYMSVSAMQARFVSEDMRIADFPWSGMSPPPKSHSSQGPWDQVRATMGEKSLGEVKLGAFIPATALSIWFILTPS